MHLMADAVAVLGSRHGILVDPCHRKAAIIRYDRWTRLPELHLRLGVVIDGVERVLPLTPDGQGFAFVDQRSSACRSRFIAIDEASNLRFEADLITPFRPRDADFSTLPVLAIRLRAQVLPGIFRWKRKSVHPESVELCIGIAGPALTVTGAGDALELRFSSTRARTKETFSDVWDTEDEPRAQHDRLVAPGAQFRDGALRASVDVSGDRVGELTAYWCTHDTPVMDIRGDFRPFRYASRFADLDAVCAWARRDGASILGNADRVEAIVHGHDQGTSLDKLLAYTLHSWLAGSWWATKADGSDWFSVWEGTCYFHATVDVEFTQCPFYLACWPELLEIQLDNWTDFSLPGERVLGEAGRGTRYLSHDCGAHARADRQIYSHDMPVEEAANWLIMAAAHYRRSGVRRIVERHRSVVADYARFIMACATGPHGIPDQGVANTIDDASPAVQFGKEQTYLAAKAAAALVAAAVCLEAVGDHDLAAACRARVRLITARIEATAWLGDHYGVLLERSGDLTNPWSGERHVFAEIPGWDAYHIYTANALPPLDMCGIAVGLDGGRLTTDLRSAAAACLEEYGCSHSSFANTEMKHHEKMLGLAGVAQKPGWIAMNLARDMAAAYRGVDLRRFVERYWDWQATTNTQEARLFFETFKGNNLCFYPRGVVAWGLFDALAGLVIDGVAGIDRAEPRLRGLRVPRLWDADWAAGTCRWIEA